MDLKNIFVDARKPVDSGMQTYSRSNSSETAFEIRTPAV